MVLGKVLPPLSLIALGYLIVSQLSPPRENPLRTFLESMAIGIFVYIFSIVSIAPLIPKLVDEIVFLIYASGILSMIVIIIQFLNNVDSSFYVNLQERLKSFNRYWILWVFVILDYILINLLYPPRGWDALQFYFPLSEYIYVTDSFEVAYNPLTLFPTAKAPVNILLFSYSIYTTEGFNVELFPVIFLIGISIATIELIRTMEYSDTLAILGGIAILLMPLVYIHIIEFAFYQDLPLGLFFSIGMIYSFLATRHDSNYYAIIASVSFSLAILSKITGYTIFFIFLLAIPLRIKGDKLFKLFILGVVSFVLVYKAITEVYILLGIVILVVSLLLSVVIHQQENNAQSTRLAVQKAGLVLVLPLISGIIWLQRIKNFENYFETLVFKYLILNQFSIQWQIENDIPLPLVYLENAHVLNVFVMLFVVFLGYAFVPTMILPKLQGIKSVYKTHKYLIIWTFSFYGFWMAYHATTSIRYLTPIIVPLNAFGIIGIKELVDKWGMKKQENLIVMLFLATFFFFYYPVLPISGVLLGFHERFLFFHTHYLKVLVYAVVFTMSIKILRKPLQSKNMAGLRRIKLVLVLWLVVLPIIVQSSVFIKNEFDVKQTQAELVYDNRESVTNLVSFLHLYTPQDHVIIGVNIPGIAFYTKIPVIDLYFASSYVDDETLTILLNENENYVYEELSNLNITIIITPTDNHPFNPIFDDQYLPRYLFFEQPNSNFTQLIYLNREFSVWQINNEA